MNSVGMPARSADVTVEECSFKLTKESGTLIEMQGVVIGAAQDALIGAVTGAFAMAVSEFSFAMFFGIPVVPEPGAREDSLRIDFEAPIEFLFS
jgi:hypothetical protein